MDQSRVQDFPQHKCGGSLSSPPLHFYFLRCLFLIKPVAVPWSDNYSTYWIARSAPTGMNLQKPWLQCVRYRQPRMYALDRNKGAKRERKIMIREERDVQSCKVKGLPWVASGTRIMQDARTTARLCARVVYTRNFARAKQCLCKMHLCVGQRNKKENTQTNLKKITAIYICTHL